MADATDLVEALVAADLENRAKLLRDAEPGVLEEAIGLLGHRHELAAAEVLALIDVVVEDRALRKAARREAHRLRSAGLDAPPPTAAPSDNAARRTEPQVQLSQAWATDIDPTGSRAVWLLGERALGGAWLGSALVNDLNGLEEVNVIDTTRKRVLRELEERRREGTWVSFPGDYALQLVREAVDLSRARGASPPSKYRTFRDTFGEASSGPERPLVYETVSPLQATFTTESIDQSARLLAEPELAGWHVAVSDELRERTLEVARAGHAALLVPAQAPEQQALALVGEAARQALTPDVKRSLRRRLEETGYVFVASERLSAARLAVAAAKGIDDPHVAPEFHPLLRLMLAGGLARLLRSEAVGGRPAADVFIELVERGAEQAAESGGRSVEARPSGLILPR